MHMILLILKILGIAVLVILGAILFLLLLVLFVPIRYSVEGRVEKDLRFEVKGGAHWLLHIFSVHFSYLEKEASYAVRVLGKRLKPDGKEGKTVTEEEILKEMEGAGERIADAAAHEAESASGMPEEDTKDIGVSPEEEREDIVKKKGENSKKSIYNRLSNSIGNFVKNVKAACLKIPETFRNLKEKILGLKEIITSEADRQAVEKVFHELKYLIRHIMFRKIRTDMKFSLGDPATTGKVLGILSLMPALYRYDVHLYPDFEAGQIYMEGSFHISGRVRLIHILISALRLVFEKNVRALWKRYRHRQESKKL